MNNNDQLDEILASLPEHPTILLLRKLLSANIFTVEQKKQFENIIYVWIDKHKKIIESFVSHQSK